MTSTLNICAVTRRYGSPDRGLEVLSPLTADVRDGECVAIVGPSGCGKSSLLSIIAGHRPATTGEVVFEGRKVFAPHPERQLMQQHDSLLPHLTVEENLELALTAMQWRSAPMLHRWVHAFRFGFSKLLLNSRKVPENLKAKTNAALNEVGLAGFASSYPKSLSGGMRRRAELARCLLADGKLLLLDEPFTGLDALAREQMHELIDRVWIQKGKTCVIVTHDWNEAAVLADRILVMSSRPGRIVSEIKVNLPRPRNRSVQVSDAFMQIAGSLHETLRHES
jgi:NitT/TauT family transport system ATP-binding protein